MAYNASTDQRKWPQPNVSESIGTPTVADGRVYVATGTTVAFQTIKSQ